MQVADNFYITVMSLQNKRVSFCGHPVGEAIIENNEQFILIFRSILILHTVYYILLIRVANNPFHFHMSS